MYKPQFRCSSKGVPILSHDEIDFHAEQFIRDFDEDILRNPREVDIEKFAEYYLGLTPEYNYLTHCGLILGRMVFNDSDKIPIYDVESQRAEYISAERGTVMIDNTLMEDEHRFRSTLGHESGHWIYQQSYYYINPNQMTLFDLIDRTATACRKYDIEGGEAADGQKKPLSTDHDWLEHQAKYFSASILMPKEAMKLVCSDLKQKSCFNGRFPQYEEEIMAMQVAEIFNVSIESAKIRIRQLDLGYEKPVQENKNIFTIGYPERMISL